MNKKGMKLFVILMVLSSFLYAGTITGRVVIKDTQIPIRNAEVSIGKQKTTTNRKGQFELEQIGNQFGIIVTANGYSSAHKMLEEAQDTGILIEMEIKTVIRVAKQTVTAGRDKERISYHKVNKESIRRLSEAALFADTVTAIQMLPGVGSTSAFDAKMYIRGGNAYEIVGAIDDIPIYNPYFWGGRISLFNSKVAKHVDFYPGGFQAKYGQSLSGILDVQTKDGDFDESEAELDVSLTELNYVSSAPITQGESAYMVAYRRTYYDLFAPLFVSDTSGPVNMPYLQSFQAKVTQKINDTNKLKFAGYYFNEGADTPLNAVGSDEEGKFVYNGQQFILSTQLHSRLSKQLFNQLTVAYHGSDGRYRLTNEKKLDAKWNQDSIVIRNDAVWMLNQDHEVSVGGIYYSMQNDNDVTWVQIPDPEEKGSITRNVTSRNQHPVTIASLYLQDQWSFLDDHSVTVGLRLESATMGDYDRNIDFQPRISYDYQFNTHTKFKLYYGEYGQQLGEMNRTLEQNGDLKSQLADLDMERAQHYGVGMEHYISDQLRVTMEGFYKEYDHLSIDTGTFPTQTYENEGGGNSKGIELMLHKLAHDDYTGWLTYTYSRTQREDQKGWYIPEYDMTHMINIYADIVMNEGGHLIATLKYRTGRPFTPILSSKKNPVTGADEYTLGERYSERLSDYFRLDIWYEWKGVSFVLPIPFLPISKEKAAGIFPKWTFKGKTRLGLYNALNTQSQTGYGWDEREQKETYVYDFPRMIIFGYSIEF